MLQYITLSLLNSLSVITGKNTVTFRIDGTMPGDTVPDATSNIFISVESMYC